VRPHAAKRPRRWIRALAILLRVVATLVVLQISGVGHVLDDLANRVFVETTIDAHHHDCDDDEPARDCPPGATGCHHGHANVMPKQPLAELLAGLHWASSGQRIGISRDDVRPRRLDLPLLERPPRRPIA